MRRYRIALEGRTFDVRVLGDPHAERVQVEVDGETFAVEIQDLSTGSMPGISQSVASSGRTVAAPLPGTIKSIAVRSGQQVATGDELLVIEAMKMDNVVRAQRGGTIGTVHVTEGRQVAHGDTLLEYRD